MGSVWGWICPWKFGFQMKNTKPDQGKRRNGPRPIEWFYVWGGNWGACIRECLRQRSKVREGSLCEGFVEASTRSTSVDYDSPSRTAYANFRPHAEQPMQHQEQIHLCYKLLHRLILGKKRNATQFTSPVIVITKLFHGASGSPLQDGGSKRIDVHSLITSPNTQ